jgi:hypothetical protein
LRELFGGESCRVASSHARRTAGNNRRAGHRLSTSGLRRLSGLPSIKFKTFFSASS